jgi:hypothetical protein
MARAQARDGARSWFAFVKHLRATGGAELAIIFAVVLRCCLSPIGQVNRNRQAAASRPSAARVVDHN